MTEERNVSELVQVDRAAWEETVATLLGLTRDLKRWANDFDYAGRVARARECDNAAAALDALVDRIGVQGARVEV